jgi:hypothetical protein
MCLIFRMDHIPKISFSRYHKLTPFSCVERFDLVLFCFGELGAIKKGDLSDLSRACGSMACKNLFGIGDLTLLR